MERGDRQRRNEAAYDSMNVVTMLVIPFFVLGAFFGVRVQEDWVLRGPIAVIGDFWVGLVLAAVGGYFWVRRCRRRQSPGWIRWAPVWAFVGSFGLGVLPGLADILAP